MNPRLKAFKLVIQDQKPNSRCITSPKRHSDVGQTSSNMGCLNVFSWHSHSNKRGRLIMFDFSRDLTVRWRTSHLTRKKPTRSFPTDFIIKQHLLVENKTRGRCDVAENHCAFGSLIIKPKL